MKRNPRVAIVHDWLYGGGAERVIEELHKMFPDAPIYTSYCTPEWRKKLDDAVITGWLQHFGKLRKFLALPRGWWFRSLDLSEFDLVISSSGNGEAKFIRTEPETKHVCYCHTPPHFYWAKYDEYLKNPGFRPAWLVRLGLKLLVGPLKKRDYAAAQKVDYFIANSSHIQADIKKYYGRESEVVFPPVVLERFSRPRNKNLERTSVMISGRQTPYKHFDIAVEACTKLGLPMVVVGAGPEEERLKQLAGPTVKFLGRANDDLIEREFASAKVYIFTSLEDFGISPVEALASGTPVLAYKAGGALDYIEPGKNGEFFDEQTTKSLVKALKKFDPADYDQSYIKKSAAKFSSQNFQKNIRAFLGQKI